MKYSTQQEDINLINIYIENNRPLRYNKNVTELKA